MPTYEYECSQCGMVFEHFQSMTSAPLTDCPDESCGGKETVKRLISSGGGIIFKGSGFYQTDYKKSGASPSAPAKSESCASCPKAETGKCPAAE